MSAFKKDHFSNRLTSAAAAKEALLARFRARPGPDDPAVVARRAAQSAIDDAREIRAAERKVARAAEEARLAVEREVQAQEALAEAAAKEAAKAAAVAESLELAAQRKAARDAKYAARVARRK